MTESPKRRRLWPWLLGFGVLAVLGAATSLIMFSSWSEVRQADALEAQGAFEQALAGPAIGPAYLTLDEQGAVHVDRSLEGEAQELSALVLLTWDLDDERLLQMTIPFWFVRVKSSDQINLGTVTTFLAKDWAHLKLSVTEDDLEQRGPGAGPWTRPATMGRA